MQGEETPLIALLSQTLVAYTIEFDNEAEHQMPHKTADGRPGEGPWLFSLAMWANSVRLMPTDDEITIENLARAARTGTNVDGIRRWGYVTVTRPDGTRIRAGMHRPAGCTLRLTERGRRAQAGWATVAEDIEARWRKRHGAHVITALRSALVPLAHLKLPDCLPILGYGLWGRGLVEDAPPGAPARELPLWGLLSRALTALARGWSGPVAPAIAANVFRVAEAPVPIRKLPAATGVSKEAIAMAINWLTGAGFAGLTPLPTGRGKQLVLTDTGAEARNDYARWAAGVRQPKLRAALEPIIGDGSVDAPLFAGLTPYPDNWRAARERNGRGALARRTPLVLPHFPTVLHRGGFPDGS